jgi:ribosomal protein L11 methyltransferase
MTPFDIGVDKEAVLDIVYQSQVKLTPLAFIKQIKSKFLASSSEAKKIIKKLIDDQHISYHYLYGATYIEKSFLKPVKVSNHFILKPPGFQKSSKKKDIELTIETGISFGSGQHPTTQLCLKAIDFCFFEMGIFNAEQSLKVCADIGTGSGVLAMAVCKAGNFLCNAYEIDPVSINEAKKNIILNNLSEKIKVIDNFFYEQRDTFSIICANLRCPTLKDLSGMIFKSLKETGIAILSGVRVWEKEDLIFNLKENEFEIVWQEDDKKWSGFVLKKKV